MLILYGVLVSVVISWCELPHISGAIRDDSRQNTQNGGETIAISNSTVQAPPWPAAGNNSNMYLVTKSLNQYDKIEITGSMKPSHEKLLIQFLGVDEYNNADEVNPICQLDVNKNDQGVFTSTAPALPINVNGHHNFEVSFEFLKGDEVKVNNVNTSAAVKLDIAGGLSDIKYISISGDVNKISEIRFIFK